MGRSHGECARRGLGDGRDFQQEFNSIGYSRIPGADRGESPQFALPMGSGVGPGDSLLTEVRRDGRFTDAQRTGQEKTTNHWVGGLRKALNSSHVQLRLDNDLGYTGLPECVFWFIRIA
jgi:hypothetical protein